MNTGQFEAYGSSLGADDTGGGSEWMAALPVVAALAGGYLSSEGQKDANETNLQIAREQMAFQDRMSSSAYERAVQDMKNAGLNPMLAYSKGGASTPSGSQTTVQNALGAGVNSAQQIMASYSNYASAEQQRAQAELAMAQAEKVRSETYALDVNSAYRNYEVERMGNLKDLARADADKRLVESIMERMRLSAERGGKDPYDSGEGFAADVERRKEMAKKAPWEVRETAASARSKEMDLTRAGVEQQFYGSPLGDMNPFLRQFLEILRGISSATRANR